jgi:phosphoglycolate phosphatase-like HAD superfamily hydrolase
MASASPWLVLFDIDGTLIRTAGAGLRGMNAAFARLYGVEAALAGIPFAGRTDCAIVGDALRRIGREPAAEEIRRVRAAYVDDLRVEIQRHMADPCEVLPGVEALLDDLAAVPGIEMGLLTGNFEEGARVKLGHFDLWRRFSFGAFGDEHTERRPLVPVAISRARDAGVPIPAPDRVVVIGDTPLDVDCARAHGARSVGVATGPFDREALRAAGADVVFDTLRDASEFGAWLEDGRGR